MNLEIRQLRVGLVAVCVCALGAGLIYGSENGVGDVAVPASAEGEVRGVLVVRDGKVLAADNADQRLTPASVTKLVTAAAILERLGPDYRFRTSVFAESLKEDSDGTKVAERLVVAASGDPTWSEEFYKESPETPLQLLIAQVYDSGIRRISGDLVVETTAVMGRRSPVDWPASDASLGYGAAPSALALKDNRSKIRIAPGAVLGRPATIENVGPGVPLVWRNESTTVSAERDGRGSIEFDLDWGRNSATLRGEYPISEPPFVLDIATPDPDQRAARQLLIALGEAGVEVGGEIVLQYKPLRRTEMVEVAMVESPPLKEILVPLLSDSNNFIAEMLLRHLGFVATGEGRLDLGIDVVTEFLEEQVGVDAAFFEIDDGSGLSPFNLLSPRAVVQLLEYAWSRPWRTHYFEALASDRQGTVGDFWPKAPPLRAKTGTLRQTQCLAGVLLPKGMTEVPPLDGDRGVTAEQPIFFAWMVNHSTRARRDIRREVIKSLWEWRG